MHVYLFIQYSQTRYFHSAFQCLCSLCCLLRCSSCPCNASYTSTGSSCTLCTPPAHPFLRKHPCRLISVPHASDLLKALRCIWVPVVQLWLVPIHSAPHVLLLKREFASTWGDFTLRVRLKLHHTYNPAKHEPHLEFDHSTLVTQRRSSRRPTVAQEHTRSHHKTQQRPLLTHLSLCPKSAVNELSLTLCSEMGAHCLSASINE